METCFYCRKKADRITGFYRLWEGLKRLERHRFECKECRRARWARGGKEA